MGEQVELWDLKTPRRVQVLYRDKPVKITFNSNGGYTAGPIMVQIRRSTGPRPQEAPLQILFNADSRKLAIIYGKGGIVIYDVPEGKELRRFGIIQRDAGQAH